MKNPHFINDLDTEVLDCETDSDFIDLNMVLIKKKDSDGRYFYNCIRLSDPFGSTKDKLLIHFLNQADELKNDKMNIIGQKCLEVFNLNSLDELKPSLISRLKGVLSGYVS